MEWDREHDCLVSGPDAQAEADLHELGVRVSQEFGYQAVWLEFLADPVRYA